MIDFAVPPAFAALWDATPAALPTSVPETGTLPLTAAGASGHPDAATRSPDTDTSGTGEPV